jgi:hypothetical protein
MTLQDAFSIWAPEDALWTEWAKPVAFTGAITDAGLETPMSVPTLAIPGLPESWADAAIVVDLPGEEAVTVGLALAERGFRPVPLFNGTIGPNAVIDVLQITRALGAAAPLLAEIAIKPDARPAFLLDSRRGELLGAEEPGRYDNRWVVLPQDFPSGVFLGSRGIHEVVLIQRGESMPAQDLTHVLYRWQQAGIRMRAIDLASGRTSDDLRVRRPSLFRAAWYVAIALLGLRRSNVGGFGSMVPEQTARSGFYG